MGAAVGAQAGAAAASPAHAPDARPEAAQGGAAAASPDWRDQVVYFLMTDRFADGDPANNDQGHKEYGPADGNLYSGGDLEGIRRKLDYIQGLGATAVWLTPPVANVWYDPVLKMAGYHGYWAENFKKVDAHLGTLEDYRRLSAELHGRGMFLIQDIVANHTGDFFDYAGKYDPVRAEANFRLKEGVFPPRPSQPPFDRNDVTQPDHKRSAVYHWTPGITDYHDEGQRLTYQMSGLDDLNTANPAVREALRDAYDFWISTADVDGFRIDTAHFVEHGFWHDFIHSTAAAAPGVRTFAAGLGKKDFLTFGEVWLNPTPFSDQEEKQAARYLGTGPRPEMGAILNFPLTFDLRAVFAKGAPPARLKYRLDGLNRHFKGGRASVNFVDNHDMSRFLSEGSERSLAQALALVFTVPGIPVVYMGTEQGRTETRSAMFAAGFQSGGHDHFDAAQPVYGLIRELAALRRDNAAFRRGKLTPLYGAPNAAGPLAYRLDEGKNRCLVIFNTAEEEALLAELETGLPEGTLLDSLFARGVDPKQRQAGKGGRLTLALPARSILVLQGAGQRAPIPESKGKVSITGVPDKPVSGAAAFSGTAEGVEGVVLIVDGRVRRPVRAALRPDGKWTASVPAAALADGEHSVVAAAPGGAGLLVSKPRSFKVAVPWTLAKEAVDPVGDDRGPSGAYAYPLADGFQGRGDIAKLSLYRRGPAAKLVIKMSQGLSEAWNPIFGFDHVCFDVYIAFPEGAAGRPGAALLPRLNASFPGGSPGASALAGAGWDFAAFLAGWKVGLYGAEGATADAFGAQLHPAPKVTADKKVGTLEVLFDLDAFKGLPSFDGARFYVTTWDYDGVEGALRPLGPKPGDYAFGGGEPGAPRIMDDASLAP